MTTPEDSNLEAILGKIGEITAQAADDDYIFRGEPECYGKVTSSLYRHYEKEVETDRPNIELAQKAILREAKQYTDETDDLEILSKLQHYGSKTNLIDFTTDLHIALFFACGHPDMDGRVILLPRKALFKPARRPRNRVVSQKSVFVQPPEGFIKPEPEKVALIPKGLKPFMLDYLRKYHGIATETLFNDLQGFIRAQGLYYEAYAEFHKGNTSLEQKNYDVAIRHFTEAIRLRPNTSASYGNRGIAYWREGDPEQALLDYNKAIELDSKNAVPYLNRGKLYIERGDYDQVVKNCTEAIKLDSDLAQAYYTRGRARLQLKELDKARMDLRNAESRGINLSEEIKTLLTPQQDSQG